MPLGYRQPYGCSIYWWPLPFNKQQRPCTYTVCPSNVVGSPAFKLILLVLIERTGFLMQLNDLLS